MNSGGQEQGSTDASTSKDRHRSGVRKNLHLSEVYALWYEFSAEHRLGTVSPLHRIPRSNEMFYEMAKRSAYQDGQVRTGCRERSIR